MPETPLQHSTALAVRILLLTRWRDHVLFTVPATLLGVNLALHRSAAGPDWRAAAVLVGNLLAVAFAFMVNDIEDAPDDARDTERAARNVIASGELSAASGWRATWGVALLAALSFAAVNPRTLALGVLTLVLSGLYSWRRVRLKALPVVDVLSHMLMLSALLLLAGYTAYSPDIGAVWLVTLGVSLISGYGQLYNQLRDYDDDRAAELRNTASVIGIGGTRWTMHVCLIGAGISLSLAVVDAMIPLWLVLLLGALSPLLLLLRSSRDMRGTAAVDLSGSVQTGTMILATVVLLAWMVLLALGVVP